ncbi:MAG: nucleoside-diphosphate kinase [Candidatus Nanoarchaeia archaeon]|nr:nucleoside-diphosphate kinase [Candidatus Nanoarchaeia archaeon]
MIEKTLVLLKPDAIQRSISGKIISRFEDTGLKIIGMKMIWPDKELAENHYPLDEEWMKIAFEKTKTTAEKENREFKFKNHVEFGKTLQSWLVDFITESPVIALVLEGPHAVELARKLTGHTEPKQASVGTIRGDFASVESYAVANTVLRTVKNLIHASDSLENAKKEISLWFNDNELYDYKTLHESYLA